jgi:hypothetical protein
MENKFELFPVGSTPAWVPPWVSTLDTDHPEIQRVTVLERRGFLYKVQFPYDRYLAKHNHKEWVYADQLWTVADYSILDQLTA